MILLDEKPKYVGECEDLAKRWNMGYGNISPRNCFIGGQPTNCRINNLILCAYKAGSEIKLLFYPTDNRFEIESFFIKGLTPEWNRSNRKRGNRVSVKEGLSGINKYQKLEGYLRNSKNKFEKLTYSEIIKIIGNNLPNSAYRYRPWWANSGQAHSKIWSSVGWKVSSVDLGNSVTFEKKVDF